MGGAALIIAARETADAGDGLPRGMLIAALPFLGRTLVEHQARQAAAAGARHIVLLVERMPAPLLAAVDRLRRDGIPIEVARAAADAADRFHPEERILLIGDGALFAQPIAAALMAGPAPALATAADPVGFDRIDATGWWAGLAVVDGATVRNTVAMLGDWDAESTLVRRVVQAGAMRMDAGPPADRPIRIEAGEMLPVAEARLVREAGAVPAGLMDRHLLAPVARFATRLIAPRQVEAEWLAFGGALLSGLGGVLALVGLPGTGLGLFLLAAFVIVTGDRLAAVRLGRIAWGPGLAMVREAGGALLLGGLALAAGGALWLTVGAGTLLAMAALRRERALLAIVGGAAPGWCADVNAEALVVAAGALAGGWPAGLVLAAAYAIASFGAVQHRLAGIMTGGGRSQV